MNPDVVKPFRGNILIVDDSPDNLRVLSNTLTEHDYKVRCVTNGEMALISIRNLLPDLILLDIRMPTMDGYEVCQQLKNNPQTKEIPVIFLSALDDVTGKVKAFELGGADYITKPFQSEEVLVRIENQLMIQRLKDDLSERNQRLQQEIDHHKQTEAALRQEIQKRLLIEAALQDAKEAAEAANYAKSEFLARMSHELRTPLNAILGFSELMQQDAALSAEYQDYSKSINQSGRHLLKLINHILAITQVEASQLALNEHSFDLVRLLDSIEAVWGQKAAAKGLRLIVDRDPTLPQVIEADESKLRQVLMGLLDNAVRFTSQGGVTLRVKVGYVDWATEPTTNGTGHSPPTRYHLSFEVADTGQGIAAHELDRLFQAFSQSETGRKLGQGMGLTLLLSRQFVQLMGGDLTLSSTLGQGTIARFQIMVRAGATDLSLTTTFSATVNPDIELQASFIAPFPKLSDELMIESLQVVMPADWLTRLHQAAIKGFDHQIAQLIQEIPAVHASLAGTLMDWNRNFQFDHIVSITRQVLERN
ncbi:hybrid sensor histidine kinase/response regulator [Pantanalinema rosaneae CENA516]|uniref:hybrid sensor histidine kinase/response regulator n=1 Tax=Pantanalinema rosaneae TaxID=1620701 RepID=UPI003D6E9B94